jgi:tetratricopeptide (TPR) repeat protein
MSLVLYLFQLADLKIQEVIALDSDISRILESWEYQPDTLIIRKITGEDGKEKIQIRVDLGILQMETEGRPDGKAPRNALSMLDYYESLMKELKENEGGNFILTEKDMEELDDELMQYYHRRVCFFALGDYSRARKDAEHNLELMSIIKEHCLDEDYIESHERFRPFVIMESARAAGLESVSVGDYAEAMKHVGNAINMIEKFYIERGFSEERIRKSRELTILRKWRSQIHQDWEGGITEMGDGKDGYNDQEL